MWFRSRGRVVKDDVASARKKAARRVFGKTAARQLPRWPDLLDYEDWLDANESLAHARKNWSMWEGLLERGSKRQEGIHLTMAECWTLLQLLRDGRPRPRGRRPLMEEKAKHIAAYSMLLEADGLPPKAAIADTEQLYNVGRSAVFAARRQYGSQIQKEGLDRRWREDAEERQFQRECLEALAELLQSE
jgi:hypothetical protein